MSGARQMFIDRLLAVEDAAIAVGRVNVPQTMEALLVRRHELTSFVERYGDALYGLDLRIPSAPPPDEHWPAEACTDVDD